ncbi:MAG: HDOD domain-containing protein [Candidatus Scalindua sp.]|nr:HDOD domain-containing protein [Candidatus Scalindua sp.]
MISNNDEKSDISHNKLLKGLSDNEIFEVCALGKHRYYKPGDTLFKEGDSDQTVYLILQGEIKLMQTLNEKEKDIAVLQKDDGLGDTAFVKDSKRIVTAVALKSSNVMIIDQLSKDMLSPEIQLRIYNNFNQMASERIGGSIHRDTKLIDQIQYIGSRIKFFIHTHSEEYKNSGLIRDILENIQSLPVYSSNLFLLLQSDNASASEVVEQAKLDPSLVGVILKTINSAYYGLRCKISDVQHAITYLGFNQVYQLVVDHGVKSTMPDTPEFQELQCHSNVVSFFSFELARLCSKNKPLMHNTIGLLHDIGKSVILLLKKQHQKLAILIDLLDHARIGSLLLEKWNLPDIVYRSVEYQCFPEFFPPSEVPEEIREYVAVLYISHICYEYAKGSKKKELPTAFLDEYVTFLNFPEKSFLPLFKNHIMPSVYKKMNACPENVRKFLMESKGKIIAPESVSNVCGGIGNIF